MDCQPTATTWLAKPIFLPIMFYQKKYFYQLCMRNLETPTHLFDECSFAQQLWTLVSQWLHNAAMLSASWTTDQPLPDWYQDLADSRTSNQGKMGQRSIAMMTIWKIWTERNDRIFRDKTKISHRIFAEIKEARMWITAGAKHVRDLGVFTNQE